MFFNRRKTDSPVQDIRVQISRLEKAAQQAHGPGGAAVFYNRAGDLLVEAGRVSNALEYYGEAIDEHVKADRFEPASALCVKVIRMVPEVVRTRCTLTWLALGNGYDGDAQEHLTRYVDAATTAGQDEIVLKQARSMADLAETESLRLQLAELLLNLGDDTGADQIFGGVFRERNALDPRRRVEPDDRRFAARHAALQGALYTGR